jgi:hypothetical protein
MGVTRTATVYVGAVRPREAVHGEADVGSDLVGGRRVPGYLRHSLDTQHVAAGRTGVEVEADPRIVADVLDF